MHHIAKVFQSGNSQAIRIPKELRFDCERVLIEVEGERLILVPLHDNPRKGWAKKFAKSSDKLLIDDTLDSDEWNDI